MLAPPEYVDYLSAHEVCHLREMNHSARFWKLVARLLPDYKRLRQGLKQEGHLYTLE
jgi:predicted metal-dependent hydrolase